jgi:hypothetical protein
MGDPELRSDETILLRTQGVYVKSIPFEGVLTNKRIILIDRAKNLLPQKEIPLVTIKDIEPGENAIRDQIITLSVLARSGETRQMILTFSRQTGGNRIRERDEWLKMLKENTSSSFDQVIRKVIPGVRQAPKKSHQMAPPRIEVISSPVSQNVPAAAKTTVKKETGSTPPTKKIIGSRPDPAPPSAVVEESGASVPSFGTYCSRCGNRVPDGSGFCNRCGSQIVVPGSMAASTLPAAAIPQPPDSETVERKIKPIDEIIRTIPRIERSAVTVPPDHPPREAPREPGNEPGIPSEQEPAAPLPETAPPVSDSNFPATDEKPEPAQPVIIDSQNSESMPPAGEPPAPQKLREKFSFKPGKRATLGIIVIIIIIAVVLGAFFLYPMISKGGGNTPDDSTAPITVPTTPKLSGTFIPPTQTPVGIVPADGISVHINYLGGWKGSYGMPSALRMVTNSGDRFYLVENATGMVQASFEKLDGSTKHALIVEIFRNGNLLTSGNTSAGFGKIILSVDTTTGVATIPQVSTGSPAVVATSNSTTATPMTGNATAISTTTTTLKITTVKTTTPVTNTTTAAQ